MQTLTQVAPVRAQIQNWKTQDQRIAFVPTMGNLHDGHLNLIHYAKQIADRVAVSIFVNPMQFDRKEDFSSYPRTLDQDQAKLVDASVDLLFAPQEETMYPNGVEQSTEVYVPGLSDVLEGALRPGHFRGVATVVTKLFNIIQPDVACFGEKDYQQLALIRQMTHDLMLPTQIISLPIVRHPDGLAMSSRNHFLTKAQRGKAPKLATTLRWMSEQLKNGIAADEVIRQATQQLDDIGFKTDSIDIVDATNLGPLQTNSKAAVILAAAYLGTPRLIDNLVVPLSS
ncbi:MAG: Pantothenate synthetase [Candidatus Celerinatantimonas neptuna]|nr:MAG: Pantothenate synthetase [Candidatus Celerinatantimonas neptuna]